MSCHLNPTKKEIEGWLDKRIHEFTVQENRNLRLIKGEWLDFYLYTEIREIFFTSFPTELYEWITKLADSQGRWKLNNPIVWTPKWCVDWKHRRIRSCTIDHWLDQIIVGFITEFAVDTLLGYSEAK